MNSPKLPVPYQALGDGLFLLYRTTRPANLGHWQANFNAVERSTGQPV